MRHGEGGDRLVFAPDHGRVPLLLARRSLNAPERWRAVATPFAIDDVFSNTGARDDHNIVAMAIDRNGFLHLSWGMHNAPLAYAVSAAPVLGRGFGARGQRALHPDCNRRRFFDGRLHRESRSDLRARGQI